MMPDYLVRYGADDEDMQAPLGFIDNDDTAASGSAAGGVSPAAARRGCAEPSAEPASPSAPTSPLPGVWTEPLSPPPDWGVESPTGSPSPEPETVALQRPPAKAAPAASSGSPATVALQRPPAKAAPAASSGSGPLSAAPLSV